MKVDCLDSGIALIVLRFKNPTIVQPFSVPLYPVVPVIFAATCGYLFYSSVVYARSQNSGYVSLSVMLGGVVVWIIAQLVGRNATVAAEHSK